jgi:hypothetical protein
MSVRGAWGGVGAILFEADGAAAPIPRAAPGTDTDGVDWAIAVMSRSGLVAVLTFRRPIPLGRLDKERGYKPCYFGGNSEG